MSRTKSEADIAAIKQSVVAAEQAMKAAVLYLQSASTPNAEAAHTEIDRVLADHNCLSPKGHVVGAGPQSYEPHYFGEGLIETGQPIVLDIYPQSTETGFWADMTRTVCIGEPPAELEYIYNAVRQVHEAMFALLRLGASCDEIHQAAVDQFAALGYETTGVGSEFKFSEGFVHSIGHGVGKEVHEEPFFGGERGNVLQVGDVITIEPGLYYKHVGGVRLEDLFLITKDGYEQLTTLPLELRLQDW